MGVLEILAEKTIGAKPFSRRVALRSALCRLDRTSVLLSPVDEFQKERIVSIVELLFQYASEQDIEERENIIRTLAEVISNEPLELPAQDLENWESDLKSKDSEFVTAAKKAERKGKLFLKKYFSLRAKAGLATQAEVARKAGLRRSYVAVIETGQHLPQQKTLQKLARAFGVDVSAFA